MTYPRIALTRTCALHECIALAEFSIAANRDEILAFLEFGREATEEGNSLTPKSITEGLLPGYPVSVGQRLLRRLEDLYYVERENSRGDDSHLPSEDEPFHLTSRANETLESGKVYIPERQAVRISYIDDVLHPTRIVGLRIDSETLWDTMARRKEQRNVGKMTRPQAERLPDCLRDSIGKKVQVFEGEREYIGSAIIENIEENVISSDQSGQNARLNLTIEHEKPPSVELVIGNNRYSLETTLLAGIIGDYQSVLEKLLYLRGLEWDAEQAAVRVSFTEVTDQSKRSFVMDISTENPILAPIGLFDSTKLEGVPVCAKTLADAKKWSEFLTMDQVTSFVGQPEFEAIAVGAINRFPRFADRLQPLSLEGALEVAFENQRSGNIDPRFWFLQAPRDLHCNQEE